MLRTLNNGAYKSLETFILRQVERGQSVDIFIRPVYSGTSITPKGLWYYYRIGGGRWNSQYFPN